MFEMKMKQTEQRRSTRMQILQGIGQGPSGEELRICSLVTMLEADNDYFNTGIVDVSHEYEKMYGPSSILYSVDWAFE